MARRIDYFMSMSSPWAYLGHRAFVEVARRHGAAVAVRPVPLRRLFPDTGGLPLPRRHPVRQRYRLVELQRWRARRDEPLRLQPRHWPFEPEALDRFVVAVAGAGLDPDPFMRRAFAAIWDGERDLSDPAVVLELAGACGLDAAGLARRAAGDDAAAAYEANLRDALALGVFGAPSYVLDGEVFWGQDRIELLDDALAAGRAAYGPDGAGD